MRKRNKQSQPTDVYQLAHKLVNLSTSKEEDSITLPTKAQVSLLMAELGRKGGKIGGKRRMQTMSARERTEIARKAAVARWKSNKSA